MKPLTTFATVSLLAMSTWAATVPGVKATTPTVPSPWMAMVPFQGASCPTPAPATKPAWKAGAAGQAEYKDFTTMAATKDMTQKAQLAAAFAQKYPDSDYKNEALQIEMAAQAGVPSLFGNALTTAQELINAPKVEAAQLLPAYIVTAFLDPNVVQPNDPDMAAKMAKLSQAATCGEQLLASAPAASQAQYGPILTKAKGFAALNTKDYAGAIANLTKAAQQNPKDPLPAYWMGIAEVTQPTPDFNAGLFYLAKASVLSPTTAAFKNYLDTVYNSYHGSADGLQDVVTAATNNSTPPADFKVLSKVDMENAANMADYQKKLEAQKNQLPPEDSFAGIEARLKKPDLAAAEWKKTKGQGYEIDGIVTAITGTTLDLAVGETDASKGAVADVHVLLEPALPPTKRPKVGEHVTVDAVVEAFKPNPPDPSLPFLMTMDKGQVKGYSPVAK